MRSQGVMLHEDLMKI